MGQCINKAKALCKFFSIQTQEQEKPFSPITENVTRADPSSTSVGRVRENSSEMVLSEEGKNPDIYPMEEAIHTSETSKETQVKHNVTSSHRSQDLQTHASIQEILPGKRLTRKNYSGCSPRQGGATSACSLINSLPPLGICSNPVPSILVL